jgi:hypothetical protein
MYDLESLNEELCTQYILAKISGPFHFCHKFYEKHRTPVCVNSFKGSLRAPSNLVLLEVPSEVYNQ